MSGAESERQELRRQMWREAFRREIDPMNNVNDRLSNGQSSSWPFIAERYVEHHLTVELYANIRQDRPGTPCLYPGKYRAVFKRAVVDVIGFGVDVLGSGELEGRILNHGTDYVEYLMLVFVTELVEHPQRVSTWLPILSVVRLQRLDDYLGVGMHSGNLQQTTTRSGELLFGDFPIPVPIYEDREFSAIPRSAAIVQDKLIGNVIKTRAEIEEKVSNQAAQGNGSLFSHSPHEQILLGVRVELSDRVVRVSFEKCLDALVQSVKVQLRPLPFDDVAVHRVTHE
jgi:hypothetical protein